MQREQKQEKIFIKLDSSEDFEIEKLWASRLDDGLYVIDNIPFLSNNVHYWDIVMVKMSDKYELYEIVSIVRPSNRFQTRIVVNECSEHERSSMLKTINEYDCVIEQGKSNYFSISLEKSEDINKFEQTLQRFVKLGWLNYDGIPFDIWESKKS